MGKKVLVLGTGAQGTTVAKRLNALDNVEKIICADYDEKAAKAAIEGLEKAVAVTVNAKDLDDIIRVAEGVDMIVNALPLDFARNVLDAAVAVKANYQDYAAGYINEAGDTSTPQWLKDIDRLYNEYGKKFEEIGKLAIIGTGSAPGVVLVAARRGVRELDSCDTIYTICYEGLKSKRYQPYWFSPETALNDMKDPAVAMINGKVEITQPFSLPIYRDYPELEGETCMFVEHAHDEAVFIAHNSETLFKGVQNAYFKYGGVGINTGYDFYRAGLLSTEPEIINGREVVPFDVILAHMPPAPKYKEEIQAIIDEGLEYEKGCMVAECIGKKDGKDVTVEVHCYAPGLVECFEKSQMTAEMYITGQGGFLYTLMFMNDKFDQIGLISSDMLTDEQVDYYFEQGKSYDITHEVVIKEGRPAELA